MRYITINELNSTIRNNLHKIPHDVDFVIGIPRSGIIVASIISTLINVPLIDIDSFCSGAKPTGGHRLGTVQKNNTKKVLVIDDTSFSGRAIREAKQKLANYDYDFIYMVAYVDGHSDKDVDFWLEDVRNPAEWGLVFYEWNIFNHAPQWTTRFLYDIDGVVCVDPPSDHNTEEYEKYIKDAIPLYIPKVKVRGFVTYRIEKYRDITSQWLAKQGITYDMLVMFNAQTREERDYSGISSAQMKAAVYKADTGAMLYIESDDDQAQQIHQMTNKPVLCTKSNKLYQ